MNPADHDAFRRKPGAHAKALRAFKAAKKAGLQMLLSSCLIKDRVFTDEFEEMMAFCAEEEIPFILLWLNQLEAVKVMMNGFAQKKM